MKEYLSKGREVYIEGRIDNRSYEDKEGVKKYMSEVVVEQFRFIGGRGDQAGAPGGGSAPEASAAPAPSAGASEDDDLPF